MKIQLLEETDAAAALLCNDEFCAQEKINGERLLIWKSANNVTGYNRRGVERAIPATTLALSLLSDQDWLIDGEVVGDTFTAFDVLEVNGNDVTVFPCAARFVLLRELSPFQLVRFAATMREKQDLLQSVIRERGEGVVFKDMRAPYLDGRHANAIKYRLWQSESFIVTDYDVAKGSIGLLRDGRDCGRCVVAFNAEWPKAGDVVEIRFTKRSATGKCINPKFLGIRSDVSACEIP
jgi:bifunctional non-homologous end joining protein LigD